MSQLMDALRRLQRIDIDAGAIADEGRTCREGIERLTTDIERLEAETAPLVEALAAIDATIKEVEAQAAENSGRIKKDEGKVSSITSDKALRALEKEMASAKKAVKLAGERLEALAADAAARRERIEAKRAEAEAARGEVNRLSAEMEGRLPQWERSSAALEAERAVVAALISPEVLGRYEAVRARRRGVGLVEARDETCQGCFMKLPPQSYIILVKGDEGIMSCPNCHRLLYYQAPEAREA